MTSTVQAPPPAPVRPAGTTEGPPEGPRSRRWLLGFWAVVFVLLVAAQPGRQTFDTKLGVTTDPWQFVSDLGQLWHDRGGFGGIADQYVGYLWPMLPYYGLTDLVGLPVWLAERLWLSLIVSVAFWGALRLAERLGVGSSASRLLAAGAYALWPVFTTVVGSTSAAALPGAFLPWVLLPLTNERYSARVAALRSALVIPFMGGVNATATLASLLPVGLYLLTRPPGTRQRRLIAWWVPGVILATAWWVVPLLLLGVHGENFLPYVESSQTTTATMSATEALRGAGNWVGYLHFGEAWLPAGWSVAASVIVILSSALAAGLGLAGLARRDMPERRWLVLTVLVVALITLAGYGGVFGAPFHGVVQDWLNSGLAPFRNIYKFQTGLALALVLGLAHLVGVAVRAHGARRVRGRRFAPLIAAVLVIPGLLWPYLNGSVLQPGSFQELPKYWQSTADWLEKYSPDSRALVVPATAHGIYTWGTTVDQPLDVLAESRWAQRDYVPFGTPGNRRAMDAVEQALLTGAEVPGLADYLSRAGLYYVVVRNDLDPDQIGSVPTTTVKRTLEQSGYERVTGLGPTMTGGRIAEGTPLQVEGLYARQRAVEIYRPAEDVPRPGQAGLKAIADTAVVSGGPESLLPLAADPELRDRATVLTGDNHPGLGTPAVQVVGDGLRRADTRFGLVNANTSYTYTANERNPSGSVQNAGEQPKQILPVSGLDHQTVAELRGAESVTASTSGNWLFHLPQYDPVNAFDGDRNTAWAEGAAGSANGQWLRIDFDGKQDIPETFEVTPLPQDGVRSAPTRIKVETERGSRSTNLQADGSTQTVNARPGETSWLKITILDSARRHAGIVGAGFAEVDIPGVKVTRMLRLPTDAKDAEASAELVSIQRAADPTGLSPTGTEPGLHRTFATTTAGTYEVKATAVPVPGEELDKLLYKVAPEQQTQIMATAESTASLGAGLSPRNLTDGDLTTAWIAGDDPTIHLSWKNKWPVGSLVLAPAGGLSTRPTQVEISSPDGAVIAAVDENGWVRFDPINTDQLDITITETAPLTVHNPVADEDLQLPVGLTEAYIPDLDQYRTPQPAPTRDFELPCGEGPAVEVDGTPYETSAKGTVRDLVERRSIELTLCQNGGVGGGLQLEADDRHTVESEDSGALAVTTMTLTRGSVAQPAAGERDLGIRDWLGDRRAVTVGDGAASYLTTYENFNDGWKATLNGRELTPVRLDGWQQGWRVPGGAGGTVKLSYEPSVTYEAGLIGAGVGLAALIGLALWRRREPNPDEPQPTPPGPGLWLGTIALTVVGIVIAGFLALLVPLLALLAWKRHTLLVPIAFLALAGAGLAAAFGAGEPVAADEGAFGHVAQLLALTGLFAALVSVGADAVTAPERPGSTRRFEVPPGATAPTAPLPQRRRVDKTLNGGPGAGGSAGTGVSGGGGSVASPTISARGPGSPQGETDPETATATDTDTPTRRIPFTKPKSKATPPPPPPPSPPVADNDDGGTGKGGPA